MSITEMERYMDEVSYPQFKPGGKDFGTKMHAGYVMRHVWIKFGPQTEMDWVAIVVQLCGVDKEDAYEAVDWLKGYAPSRVVG